MNEIEINLTYEQVETIYHVMVAADEVDCSNAMALIRITKDKKAMRGSIKSVIIHGTCTTEYSTGNIW